MRISLPRRHRRKLLLPPGLLALAGLLWLGCFQIGRDLRLKRYSVLDLTMPMLHASPDDPVPAEYNPVRFSVIKLNAFRPWRDIYLTGISSNIWHEHALVTNAIHDMMADSTHDGGVRVQFASTTHH